MRTAGTAAGAATRPRSPSATLFGRRRSDPCIPAERLLASAFRSPSMALGLVERPSWLFRPACRRRSESARAGSEKSLQIIFPME